MDRRRPIESRKTSLCPFFSVSCSTQKVRTTHARTTPGPKKIMRERNGTTDTTDERWMPSLSTTKAVSALLYVDALWGLLAFLFHMSQAARTLQTSSTPSDCPLIGRAQCPTPCGSRCAVVLLELER